MKRYSIKPLEWRKCNWLHGAITTQQDDTDPSPHILIESDGEDFKVIPVDMREPEQDRFKSMQAAKEKAQEIWEDYLKRYLEVYDDSDDLVISKQWFERFEQEYSQYTDQDANSIRWALAIIKKWSKNNTQSLEEAK